MLLKLWRTYRKPLRAWHYTNRSSIPLHTFRLISFSLNCGINSDSSHDSVLCVGGLLAQSVTFENVAVAQPASHSSLCLAAAPDSRGHSDLVKIQVKLEFLAFNLLPSNKSYQQLSWGVIEDTGTPHDSCDDHVLWSHSNLFKCPRAAWPQCSAFAAWSYPNLFRMSQVPIPQSVGTVSLKVCQSVTVVWYTIEQCAAIYQLMSWLPLAPVAIWIFVPI